MTLTGPAVIAGLRPLRILTLVGVTAKRGPSRASGGVTLILSGSAVARIAGYGAGAATIVASGQAMAVRTRRAQGQGFLTLLGEATGRRARFAAGAAALGLGGTVSARRGRLASGIASTGVTGQASGTVYEGAAAAYIARMSTAPTSAHASRVDALFRRWKASSVYSYADIVVANLLANETLQGGCLNAVGTYATATPVGGPGHNGQGAAGDGATSYLDLGVGFAGLPGVSLTNHAQFAWASTDSNENRRDCGTTGTANNYIIGRSVSMLTARAGGTTSQITATVATSLGMSGIIRAGTTISLCKNDALLNTAEVAAIGFGNGNVCVLQSNNSYCNRRIAGHFVFKDWTPAKAAAFYADTLPYMQAMGLTS